MNAAKTNKSILDRKRVKILNTHEYLPNPIGEVGRNISSFRGLQWLPLE